MHSANVQLRAPRKGVNVWPFVANPPPPDVADSVLKRISLDLNEIDFDFLERMADYRNALAVAAGNRITPWSRKSLCEAYIAQQAATQRAALAEMFAALGPFPEDKEAMTAYVKRALALDKKSNK